MANLLRRILRTELAWKLSGISYPSAVIATHGLLESPREYLSSCGRQMSFLRPLLEPSAEVMEFGCGLGGNLIAISPLIRTGTGLDINELYLRQARRLAGKAGCANLSFIRPHARRDERDRDTFDLIFSIGVFERIPKSTVAPLLAGLSTRLRPGGALCIYFLTVRARRTSFTRILGEDAYVYWDRSEVLTLLDRIGCVPVEFILWGKGGRVDLEANSTADLVIARRPAFDGHK